MPAVRYAVSLLIALVMAGLPVGAAANAQEVSGDKVTITITSCEVAALNPDVKAHDCKVAAVKALGSCQEAQGCEIPIGLNLTDGEDIDPLSGFLGKTVTIKYSCGEYSMQAGPYQQDDHANIILDCSGMWW